MGSDRLSPCEVNKSSLVYSQAEGQRPLSHIKYDYNNKRNKKQVVAFSNIESELSSSLQQIQPSDTDCVLNGHQNCKRTNFCCFCCFKPPSVWQLLQEPQEINTMSDLIEFIPLIHWRSICHVPTLCQALLLVLRCTGQSRPCPMELQSSCVMRAQRCGDDYLKGLVPNN